MMKWHVEEEQSFRRYVLCEEDRATLTDETWNGGYRWFRSENVVCFEHYGAAETIPRLHPTHCKNSHHVPDTCRRLYWPAGSMALLPRQSVAYSD